MADIPASNWNETDASNSTAAPDGAPEGMAPSGVNDTMRAMMGAIKRFFNWQSPKTTAGTSTAYTLTYTVAPGGLVDGMVHLVRFNAANGAAATLNVNGLGAKPLYSYRAGAWAAVSTGAITTDAISRASYNTSAGAYFLLDVNEGSAWVDIQTGSGAQIDFQNIPSGINHILIEFSVTPGTAAAKAYLRFYDGSGVLDSGANYGFGTWAVSTAAGTAPVGTQPSTGITMTGAMSSISTDQCAGDIQLSNIQAPHAVANFRVAYRNSDNTTFIGITGFGHCSIAGGGSRLTGVRIGLDTGVGTWRGTLTGRA